VIPIIPLAAAVPATAGSGLVAPPPLALYVHWPWCVKKCPYCDFNSHESRSEVDEAAYLAALIADLEAALPQVWNRPVGSIFIGGGTPSLMRAATVEALLAAIRMRVPLHPGAEVTLEANPGTAEAEKFAAFRAAGVNRLSVGVQSFDDAKLAALGRIHGGAEARRAIDMALTSLRAREHRPDVCAAGTDPGRRRERHRHRGRDRRQPCFRLPPDAGAEHALPSRTAVAARRGPRGRHAGQGRGRTGRRRLRALRDIGFCPAGRALPAQPQLLELRRLPRHRCRRPRQAVEPRDDLARGAPSQSAQLSRGARLAANSSARARMSPVPTCPANS
jgi:hypothetical protein